MSDTIPPTGSKPKALQTSPSPMLTASDFPFTVIWTVKYPDGDTRHGMNLVLSLTALNAVKRLLREEEDMAQGTVMIRVMRCPELAAEPKVVRACTDIRHNHPGRPQDSFCCECGLKTRLVAFTDGE